MYLPNQFKEADPERLAALLRDYPFGMLITMHDGLPFVSHIPFLYEQRSGAVSVLLGHVAKANPQWRDLAQNETALVVFQGPHGYVSPSWYESPGVPTWNYAAVHVYGKARVIDDADVLEKLVEKFTAVFESTQPSPWRPDISGERRTQLLGAIVGFEIEVQKMQGKFKLSQNRSAADQRSVIDHLSQSPFTSEVAKLMKAYTKPDAAPR